MRSLNSVLFKICGYKNCKIEWKSEWKKKLFSLRHTHPVDIQNKMRLTFPDSDAAIRFHEKHSRNQVARRHSVNPLEKDTLVHYYRCRLAMETKPNIINSITHNRSCEFSYVIKPAYKVMGESPFEIVPYVMEVSYT